MNAQRLEKLISELQTGNAQQRRAASYKLGKSKNAEVLPALMQAFDDNDSSVHRNVIDGLRKIGSQEAIDFLNSKEIPVTLPANIKNTNSLIQRLLIAFLVGHFISIITGVSKPGCSYVMIYWPFAYLAAFVMGMAYINFLVPKLEKRRFILIGMTAAGGLGFIAGAYMGWSLGC